MEDIYTESKTLNKHKYLSKQKTKKKLELFDKNIKKYVDEKKIRTQIMTI